MVFLRANVFLTAQSRFFFLVCRKDALWFLYRSLKFVACPTSHSVDVSLVTVACCPPLAGVGVAASPVTFMTLPIRRTGRVGNHQMTRFVHSNLRDVPYKIIHHVNDVWGEVSKPACHSI